MNEAKKKSIIDYYQERVYVDGLPKPQELSDLEINLMGGSHGYSNWLFVKAVNQFTAQTNVKFKELAQATSKAIIAFNKRYNQKISPKI